jgi:hypothetical protein
MSKIWLEEPIHKNHLKFETEGVEGLHFSRDGSIYAFDSSLLKGKEDLIEIIKQEKLGYQKYEYPKKIDSIDNLVVYLIYYSEEE